jgi:hypothetical protein
MRAAGHQHFGQFAESGLTRRALGASLSNIQDLQRVSSPK